MAVPSWQAYASPVFPGGRTDSVWMGVAGPNFEHTDLVSVYCAKGAPLPAFYMPEDKSYYSLLTGGSYNHLIQEYDQHIKETLKEAIAASKTEMRAEMEAAKAELQGSMQASREVLEELSDRPLEQDLKTNHGDVPTALEAQIRGELSGMAEELRQLVAGHRADMEAMLSKHTDEHEQALSLDQVQQAIDCQVCDLCAGHAANIESVKAEMQAQMQEKIEHDAATSALEARGKQCAEIMTAFHESLRAHHARTHLKSVECLRPGCGKPSWDGRPDDWCSTSCKNAPPEKTAEFLKEAFAAFTEDVARIEQKGDVRCKALENKLTAMMHDAVKRPLDMRLGSMLQMITELNTRLEKP